MRVWRGCNLSMVLRPDIFSLVERSEAGYCDHATAPIRLKTAGIGVSRDTTKLNRNLCLHTGVGPASHEDGGSS